MRGPFYTRKALSEYFRGVAESKIDRWLNTYRIPTCGPDGKLYAASDLEAFVADPTRFLPAKKSVKNQTVDFRDL